MHSYRKSKNETWTVGFDAGVGWRAMRDFGTEEAAAAWCSYLNGGEHPRQQTERRK
jgi:hypothetical protein